MAIIRQRSIFSWRDIDDLQDLERLCLVIEYMPDEELMRDLEIRRKNGRNKHPVRGVWNSVLAGIVFGHESVEQLRRELGRNGQLRELCGLTGKPSSSCYSRFFEKLMQMPEAVEAMFDRLLSEIAEVLPGFGSNLAVDSKAIHSHGRPLGISNPKRQQPDGRRDTDADVAIKEYRGKKRDTAWQRVVGWFGYKLHLVVDASYELPVEFEVAPASSSDIRKGHELVDKLEKDHPDILDGCEVLLADRGYDDVKLIRRLWDDHEVRPIIDIRNIWRDGEDTKVLGDRWNVVYDYRGQIYCHCPQTSKRRKMAYGGFEKDRQTLKYRCPVRHYGVDSCRGRDRCKAARGLRVPMSYNRRVFTPVARPSHRWKRLYRKRTSVERVFSRMDVSFGFERHYIRGLAKMRLRCTLTFCVMLAMALGRVKEKRPDLMRSLVRVA